MKEIKLTLTDKEYAEYMYFLKNNKDSDLLDNLKNELMEHISYSNERFSRLTFYKNGNPAELKEEFTHYVHDTIVDLNLDITTVNGLFILKKMLEIYPSEVPSEVDDEFPF